MIPLNPLKNIIQTMKDIKRVAAVYLSKFWKLGRNAASAVIRLFNPVKKGRVVLWAYDFKQYSCNPKALTEYILEHHPEYEVWWVFRKRIDISALDGKVNCVRFRTLEYQKIINTAEFIITNCRTDPYSYYWRKRKGQKYIMQWHGGVALKKVEKDAEDKFGYKYLTKAKADSKACDLMISGSGIQTDLISSAFWYDKEILEKGTPRNDIFFDTNDHSRIKADVCKIIGVPQDSKLVLYAPTFRKPVTIEPYRIDWKATTEAFRKFFGCENVTILLRLHPNLIGRADTSSLLNDPAVVDMTRYHDMAELLCISDVLITDYSSSMFDYSLLKRPCILYATDLEAYDRGYYHKFSDLPYPIAQSQEELLNVIESFDAVAYQADLEDFMTNTVRISESGEASKAQVEWMKAHSL